MGWRMTNARSYLKGDIENRFYSRTKCKLKIDHMSVLCPVCVTTCSRACSSDASGCCGAPLTPWAFINITGTHLGFDINDIADLWLQPLMVQPEVLTVRGKGINWLLSQESEGRGGQQRARVCVVGVFPCKLPLNCRCLL